MHQTGAFGVDGVITRRRTILDALPAPDTSRQRLARGVLATGLLLLGLYTLRAFLPALVWAGIFAIALWPFYRRTLMRPSMQRHTTLLPLVFTLVTALVFILPIALVGFELARESHAAADWLHEAQANGIPEPEALHHLPYGEPNVAAWWQANLAEPGAARSLLGRVAPGGVGGMGRDVGEQVVRRVTLFAFTIVSLFFLFRDGDRLVSQLRRASTQAFGPSGESVGRQIIASVHGTVNGLVLVGLGEGLLMAIVYAVAGVPHFAIFGLVTAGAAMVPFAAPVVFALAALLLVAQGATVAAVVVFAVGMAVAFTADHFIRPVLIGGATKLPFVLVLLGILGGVEVWGLIGLFVGPAIMAALTLMWRDYARVRG